MLVFNVEQGTDAWHQARAGKITASMYPEIQKKLKSGSNKGGYTKAAMLYGMSVALQRITGRVSTMQAFETQAMKRGRELEPACRQAHEDHIDELVQVCGFISTDCERFGASCDGLIGDEGVAEYKCFEDAAKVIEIALDGNLEEVEAQFQGQLWIANRQYADFCLYHPDLAPKALTHFRVQRNDAFIDQLVADLMNFNDTVVCEYERRLREKGYGVQEESAEGIFS